MGGYYQLRACATQHHMHARITASLDADDGFSKGSVCVGARIQVQLFMYRIVKKEQKKNIKFNPIPQA